MPGEGRGTPDGAAAAAAGLGISPGLGISGMRRTSGADTMPEGRDDGGCDGGSTLALLDLTTG
jgi:hypothetical protein